MVVVVVVVVVIAVVKAVVVIIVVLVAVESFSFGIKHSYNMITNPIQVNIINLSLTTITV